MENSLISFVCDVRGDPQPTISWTLNGKNIKRNKRISLKGRHLEVRRASVVNDQGIYGCLATNKWGTVMSHSLHINVTGEEFLTF